MTSSSSDVLKDTAPSKSLAWWIPNIDHKITPEVRRNLETYSKIPPEDVTSHVYAIREMAWSIRPWPCTGLGTFFSPTLPKLPIYPSIVRAIKAGGKHLDVGCYCGTDLRSLVIDGCPQENLFGTDFVNHWDVGFELFRDRDRLNITYIEADILNPNPELLSLRGKMDSISAVHMLHNWDWATQVKAAANIVAYTKLGCKIIGVQIGTNDSSTCISKETVGVALHNVESFEAMWEEVGKITSTVWSIDAEMREWDAFGSGKEETMFLGPDAGMLQFTVMRVQ